MAFIYASACARSLSQCNAVSMFVGTNAGPYSKNFLPSLIMIGFVTKHYVHLSNLAVAKMIRD